MGGRGTAALLCLVGCGQPGEAGRTPIEHWVPAPRTSVHADPFEPIPVELELDARHVALGRRLFFDRRLSGHGDRSCASCHELETGGVVPGERRSNHPRNATGPYNVPTVLNVAFNFRLNWNGKFATLEEHLQGPMMNEEVMNAGSWSELVARVRPAHDADFRMAGFADGATEGAIRAALAAFQRSLITPNARFDRFLRGELDLTPAEREGFDLFHAIGCASCHQGINLGGNLFQRYGIFESPFDGREPGPSDYGRKLLTGRDEDAYVFRVPSLRNVALTAPYFHDGTAETLESAVNHMARVQIGYPLTTAETSSITSFLRTLTGELDGRPLGQSKE